MENFAMYNLLRYTRYIYIKEKKYNRDFLHRIKALALHLQYIMLPFHVNNLLNVIAQTAGNSVKKKENKIVLNIGT